MAFDVAVIGAGIVGGGVIQTLFNNRDGIDAKAGDAIRLTHVCELNEDNLRGLDLDGATVTDDAASINADPNVRVVCELIGGLEPARTFILNALNAGKHVVTANKMLVAHHGPELAAVAASNGVELRYEAAVAGGIPIIKSLREGLSGNRIEYIYAILNGTCNYILTRMTYDGLEFDAVLKQAQEKGFAETPPDLDINGDDTAHKCQIIASLCYASKVDIDRIPIEGVTSITHSDVAYADEMGYLIKLLAVIQLVDGEIDARVHPALVPKDHLLAAVRNEFNAIYVQGDVSDPTLYYGKGAGRFPTASAVVADVVDIARRGDGPATPAFVYETERPLRDVGRLISRYYLRLNIEDSPGILGKVGMILGNHGVSVASCMQKDPHGEPFVHLVIMTHETVEADLRTALEEIDALSVVAEATHVLRILPEDN